MGQLAHLVMLMASCPALRVNLAFLFSLNKRTRYAHPLRPLGLISLGGAASPHAVRPARQAECWPWPAPAIRSTRAPERRFFYGVALACGQLGRVVGAVRDRVISTLGQCARLRRVGFLAAVASACGLRGGRAAAVQAGYLWVAGLSRVPCPAAGCSHRLFVDCSPPKIARKGYSPVRCSPAAALRVRLPCRKPCGQFPPGS